MFIPLKMVLIGIDPYPYIEVLGVRNQQNQLRRPSSSQQHATRRGAPAGFLASDWGGDWVAMLNDGLVLLGKSGKRSILPVFFLNWGFSVSILS